MSKELTQGQGSVSDRFLAHATFPRNLGVVEPATGIATSVGSCGESVKVSLKVEDSKIEEIKCFPMGCRFTVACSSAMSELVKFKTLDQALELGPEDIEAELGELPEDHKHCARLVVNALGEAIADHYLNENGRGHGPNF